ncbi:hypothetical protein BV898_02783 [Hypsibius exemplaris]|uniref:G-protein coupled receptors family 1 profile domain-containing protein n=1 Tax=Hypsibius exemplaris TaxID=2072580 RepID=A0A1W0X733_HYPEX|nr:hypothetical protein BV898_02783 [Hypsibius exemplaris]
MNNSSEISNVTCPNKNDTCENHIVHPTWTLMPIFYLTVCILGTVGNATTLLVILTDRALRTRAFNIYVINLLTSNFLVAAIQFPLGMLLELYGFTWPWGNPACTLFLYFQGMIQTHTIMALNRAWAIVHPVSYRRFNSARLSVAVCFGMWVYDHAAMGTLTVLDTIWYRRDVALYGCFYNNSFNEKLAEFLQYLDLLVDLPSDIIVPLSFVVVSVLHFRRHRRRLRRPAVRAVARQDVPPQDASLSASLQITTTQQVSVQTVEQQLPLPLPARPLSVPDTQQPARVLPAAHRGRSPHRKLKILGVMTASLVFFYTPLLIACILTDWIPGFRNWDVGHLYEWAMVMYASQACVDPILFTFAIDPLRKAFSSHFACLRARLQPGRAVAQGS